MTSQDYGREPSPPAAEAPRRVLYVVYWGLLEPLGQSLVLPTIRALAAAGTSVDLITFEKQRDLGSRRDVAALAEDLGRTSVRWRWLRYHKRPTALAKVFDVACGVCLAISLAVRRRPQIIHGRTPLGALMGWLTSVATGIPWICHHEGSWADQQVEGGYWRPRSLLHRLMRWLERFLHGRADGIVVLARRSRSVFESIPRVRARRPAFAVVPSCVDLARFGRTPLPQRLGHPTRLIYTGSLGGRYPATLLARFLKSLREIDPDATLLILTPADPRDVERDMRSQGALPASYSIDFVPHEVVPTRLQRASAGVTFVTPGPGALTCSPTKIGEYWASGIPVVATAGLGDVDDLVAQRRVGVIVGDTSDEALREAARDLTALLDDPGLPARCRAAAKEHYALERAVSELMALYGQVLRADRRQPD